MKKGESINYLALNQNIFGKLLVFGEGFPDGTDENPEHTLEGFKIYLNGQHKFPVFSDINELLHIGKIQHPRVQMGMPDASGELIYELGITEDAYIVLIRLKIDEAYIGESEAAVDVLALMKRADFPPNIKDNESAYQLVSKEMMFCHFGQLFGSYDSKDNLKDWEIEGDFINKLVDKYFEQKVALKNMEEELGVKSKKSDSTD
jgi:hypothetical protein